MKCYLLLLLLFVSSAAQAQQDTTWFDKEWEKASREDAFYFTPIVNRSADGHYHIKDYYKSTGKLEMDGYFLDSNENVQDGHCVYYNEDGSEDFECDVKNGEITGHYIYYSKGYSKPSSIVDRLKNDNMQRTLYYKSGQKERTELWHNSKLKSGTCFTRTGKDTTYFPAKCCPVFPGGWDKYKDYIRHNLKYPPYLRRNHITGAVSLDVKFDKTGRVVNASVEQHTYTSFEQEAKRLLYNMPRWEPAYNTEGEPQEYSATLTVVFDDTPAGGIFIDPVAYFVFMTLKLNK